MSEQTEPLVIDKSPWGDGPWQREPDRVEFVSEGFACLMQRHPSFGSWCFYVGVPATHPAYGMQPRDLDIDVHGGLNYGDTCDGIICHVPQAGMPDDVWWLGGECSHVWDVAPGLEARERAMGLPPIVSIVLPCVYRDLQYVREQTEFLAHQLREMAAA
jgi:hypothetical protein